MLLELEDLETDFAASVPDTELPIVADTDKVRVLSVRKLNPNLPRKRVVREPSCACCPGCGGDLRTMGEDSEEMLDLVAQAWQVIETIRPKYSCQTCDKIIQAPVPAKAIARGKLSYAALAHIMMAKWGYHLPFYRQAQMMAAKGVDIERSTLARSAGYAAACSIRSTTASVRSAVPTPTTRGFRSWRPARWRVRIGPTPRRPIASFRMIGQ